MDEEYDVLLPFSAPLSYFQLITFALGYCAWNRPDRMYPLGVVIRRPQESPSHGQE